MDKPILEDIEREQVFNLLQEDTWKKLKEITLEAYKDSVSNKIVTGEKDSLEELGMRAVQMKYGIRALLWFFSNIEEKIKPIVDNKQKK